jgi:2,3-bisphosphoglycerate-dependent phosphoglycerate mutase
MMASKTQPPFVVTLLRHGESIGNLESRWQGQTDFQLTDTGRAQVHALAERWKSENVNFDLIVTSPLLRAKETAEIIASALNVNVESEPLLMERDNGEYAGLTAMEVRSRFAQPDFYTPYDSVGGSGEGDWELFLRAGLALHNLLKREPAKYLIVSHGGLLNQLMHAIVGIGPQANNAGTRFRFHNTAFARLIYIPNQHRWVIDAVNDHAHLITVTE